MAVGKNKKMGKKGNKKKAIDPFTRKDWYRVKAPSVFPKREIGQTLVNRTQGTRISSDYLKGRVFEVSLGDLKNDSDEYRKFRLICEDVQGKYCLTNFHGMSFTRDKLCSIVKKWHTLIEANVAVKTTDGYLLRFFCIGFTKRGDRQDKKTCYVKASRVRQIRAKMIETIQKEVSAYELREVYSKLIPDSIGKDIEKACSYIFPLQDVFIRKVKILKKPKFELSKLMEVHGEGSGAGAVTTATGEQIEMPDAYEPPVQESV